jgi:hypothetical protein
MSRASGSPVRGKEESDQWDQFLVNVEFTCKKQFIAPAAVQPADPRLAGVTSLGRT